MFMNIPEVTPPPHSYSGGSSLSPNAVQQSETTATDTEEPAAAEIEDIEKDDNEYSHSNHSRHSRENSMSRIEKLIVQQEDYKKNSKTLSKLAINLFPPQHYDDHNDEDDEMDDENFEKILLNFTRQESQSNDKRRSMSKSNSSNYSLYRRPSPNRATNKIKGLTPNRNSIKIAQTNGPLMSRNKTRTRRAGTALDVPDFSKSPSGSYIQTMRKWNNNIPIPQRHQSQKYGSTHIAKWQSG
eukprot:100117_1